MKNRFYNPRKKSKGQAKMHPYLVAKMNEPELSTTQAKVLKLNSLNFPRDLSGVQLASTGIYKEGQRQIVTEGALTAQRLSETLGIQVYYPQ